MSMEKRGVLPDEGEAPKTEPKQAHDHQCGCSYHNAQVKTACGDDALSKMSDAAKDASPPK